MITRRASLLRLLLLAFALNPLAGCASLPRVPFTKEQLQAAPSDSLEKLTRNDGTASYATRANEYYKLNH